MKNISLLLSTMVISAITVAQPVLTNSIATNIGDSQLYYQGDTSYTAMDSLVGPHLFWNYKYLGGNAPAFSSLSNDIQDISTTAFAADFPQSNICDEIGQVKVFRRNYADSIICSGYSFYEVTAGDVLVKFTLDSLKLMQFPFTYGDSIVDNIAGTATISSFGVQPFAGNVKLKADGYGTLILPGMNYNNVLRVKVTENSTITPGFPFPPIAFSRIQYYYYQPGVHNFPVFVYNVVSALSTVEKRIYSIHPLTGYTNTPVINQLAVTVFPNPSTEMLNITGLPTEGNVLFLIIDAQGKEVINTQSFGTNQAALDVSTLATGTYFLNVLKDGTVYWNTTFVKQ